MAMLEIQNLHTYYGRIHALKDVSLDIDKREIVTLIGANGAGKSTTLNTTSGLLKPRQGSILLDGEDLIPYPPHEIVMKGVVQVPEGRRVFGRLTVIENLEMGAFAYNDRQLMNTNFERTFTLFLD
jgi:branched-chain amino acid transport system ATP-binding protein